MTFHFASAAHQVYPNRLTKYQPNFSSSTHQVSFPVPQDEIILTNNKGKAPHRDTRFSGSESGETAERGSISGLSASEQTGISQSLSLEDLQATFERYFSEKPRKEDIYVKSSSSDRALLDKRIAQMSATPDKDTVWEYDMSFRDPEHARDTFDDVQVALPKSGRGNTQYRQNGKGHFSIETPDGCSKNNSKRFREESFQPYKESVILTKYTSFPNPAEGSASFPKSTGSSAGRRTQGGKSRGGKKNIR
jgi:hypothetical protein